MIYFVDDDSPDKRSGLEIQNLDISVLTTSIDRFSSHRDGQNGALVTLEGVLQDRRGGRAIPQLSLSLNSHGTKR